MKRFLLAALVSASLPVTVSDAAPRQKTVVKRLSVVDYYFLLPYVGLEAQGTPQKEIRQERAESLKAKYKPIIDLPHDYLQVDPDSSPTAQIAVFRFKGADLIAHSEPDYQSDYNSFAFYRLQNGKLRDVTKQILPRELAPSKYLLELPRAGTTIRVFSFDLEKQSRKPAFDLLWRKGRFVVAKIKR